MKIRVRFAPSPTGFLHIGSLRTALYNFLFTKKNKGKFILRIEDTDVKRKVPGAIENLMKTLQVMGLNWDEGPFICLRSVKIKNKKSKIRNKKEFIIGQKGRYGPYFQSQRLNLYRNLAQKLVNNGYAYYCFCSKKDLEKMRQEQIVKKMPPMYDERCRKLSKKEVEEKIKQKIPYVIRLRVPEEGSVKFHDLIRGEMGFDFKNIDDQILLKSDGYPTYHLAVVVDDHFMRITHIIRGEEWLPSVPKHLLIYQAFGWQPPKFAHLPLILNPDHSKLSKRESDVAVEDYLNQGYLPEAILNFVSFLGWNPGDNREIFSLKELIKEFSLEKIQKAGAIFNREKLDWMNGYYIRKMKIGELTKKCLPYLIQNGLIKSKIFNFQIYKTGEIVNFNWLKKIVTLEQERMKKLSDLPKLANFFFQDKLEYNPQTLLWEKTTKEEAVNNLNLIKDKLKKLSDKTFKRANIQALLDKLAKEQGTGQIFWPFRVALSGKEASPPPSEISEILGKQKTIKRVKEAVNLLKQI